VRHNRPVERSLEHSRTPGAVASRAEVLEAVLGASRVLVAVAARSLAGIAEEVTLPQYRALVVLASRGPQKVAALAEALDVTPPTATRMVDRLVKKGLVRRRSSQSDRREVRVSLTQAGRSLVAQVTARRRREIAAILSRIPVDHLVDMTALLGELAEAAGELPDRDWPKGELPGQEWAAGWDL
jgi:DNA-binding MarR family transcriptional regulator